MIDSAIICVHCGTPYYVYWRTEDWTNATRGEFTIALLDAGIPHRWEGMLLQVDERYEAAVDRMLDEQGGPEVP